MDSQQMIYGSKVWDFAYCYSLESYHKHPEVYYQVGDHEFICDAWHAGMAYVHGWNNRIDGWKNISKAHDHPAGKNAYEMGYADAEDSNCKLIPPAAPILI